MSTNLDSKPFQILSLSGGGVKGLYSAKVLAEIEKHKQTKITDHFDLICGTSIGGILALALAYGKSPSDLSDLLEKNAQKIFPKIRCKNFWRVFGPLYSQAPLRSVLTDIFGDGKIKDLKTPVLIPTVNASAGQPKLFKNKYHSDYTFDQDVSLVDVALATSAAPTYFPIHSFDSKKFIDGGLVANSPALLGLHEAVNKLGIDKSNIRILSVGTMSSRFTLRSGLNNNSGYGKGWSFGKKLFDLTISANEQMHSFMVQHALENGKLGPKTHYLSIDAAPTMQQGLDLDLDNSSKASLETLKANATQSASDVSGSELLATMLSHQADRSILIN